jgi:hypothetical protein
MYVHFALDTQATCVNGFSHMVQKTGKYLDLMALIVTFACLLWVVWEEYKSSALVLAKKCWAIFRAILSQSHLAWSHTGLPDGLFSNQKSQFG